MSAEGDNILMTKGAAIETTGVLSTAFPDRVEAALGSRGLCEAKRYLGLTSTVEDAQVASSVGIKDFGVTSMHDATEGGIIGALWEMAIASRSRLRIDLGRIHISQTAMTVCRAFGLDPLRSLSGGTLLLTCKPSITAEIQKKLATKRIDCYEIGTVETKGTPAVRIRKTTGYSSVRRETSDRYWQSYAYGIPGN